MGNLIPTEVIYDSEAQVSKKARSLRTWSALATGRVREMHVWTGSVTFNNKYFNVRKNGANLFSNPNRFVVTSVDQYDSKLSLDIPVTFGDTFSFDVSQIGLGNLLTPIVFLMVTEEGV